MLSSLNCALVLLYFYLYYYNYSHYVYDCITIFALYLYYFYVYCFFVFITPCSSIYSHAAILIAGNANLQMPKKTCNIRISQLHRIRIWTDSWNLRDYDTRKAFLYQLIERKPVQGNNAENNTYHIGLYKNIELYKKNAFRKC